MARKKMRMLDELCEHLIERGFEPKTFIDVGVCYGTPELFNTLPNAYQILIEPIPSLEDRLKLLMMKFPGEYHMVAVADEAGSMLLNIPEGAIEGATLVPGKGGLKQIEVPIDTLDNILGDREFEGPILLKTDCQGFDLKVIEGAKKRLPDIDVIVMEVNLYHPRGNPDFPDLGQIVMRLKELGYSVYDIVSYQVRPRDNALGYVDLVFARDDGPLREHHSWA